MTGQPDFDVVGFLRGKTHVTGTKCNHAVVQIELLKHFLGATEHTIVLFFRFFWCRHRDQFDLCKLVLPYHAPRILAGRTSFSTETWRASREPHRQLCLLDDQLPYQIGQRHFGGWNEPVVVGRSKLVLRKLRQLRRSEHHFVSHQDRWVDFRVPVFLSGMQIEHELTKRALETSKTLLEDHKSRARQFGCKLEIHLTKRFTQFKMLFGLE